MKPSIFWVPELLLWASRTPYNPKYKDALRMAAPQARWDGEAKVWLFDESVLVLVQGLMKHYFGEYDFIPRSTQHTTQPSTNGSNPYQVFLQLIGKDIANKAYREAIKSLHPDKGGSTDDAAKLNRAWSTIKDNL